MSDPMLRLAIPSDIPQLVELRILMQKDVHGSRYPAPGAEYARRVADYFAAGLAEGSYVGAVAELAGRLVAANGLVIYRKPPSVNGGSGSLGYVSNVYTRPEARRLGLATKLMELL